MLKEIFAATSLLPSGPSVLKAFYSISRIGREPAVDLFMSSGYAVKPG